MLGLWLGMPACIEEFDVLVKKFLSTPLSDRSPIVTEAETIRDKQTDSVSKERATVYVKTMQKVIDCLQYSI